jgi:hypothetical protein
MAQKIIIMNIVELRTNQNDGEKELLVASLFVQGINQKYRGYSQTIA